jgi:hypothetical protein
MSEEPRPDEQQAGYRVGGNRISRGWRIFWAALLAIPALAFGAAGACGIVNSAALIQERLKGRQGEYDAVGWVIGIPSAIIGIIGFAACAWEIYALFRRP